MNDSPRRGPRPHEGRGSHARRHRRDANSTVVALRQRHHRWQPLSSMGIALVALHLLGAAHAFTLPDNVGLSSSASTAASKTRFSAQAQTTRGATTSRPMLSMSPVVGSSVPSLLLRRSRRAPTSTTLRYRPLDERDDEGDPSYVRVRSKAPSFGLYDVKEAIKSVASEPLQEDGNKKELRRSPPGGQPPPSGRPTPRSAMNIALIRALELNQVLILAIGAILFFGRLVLADGFQALGHVDEALNWAGAPGPVASSFFEQVLWGVGGALPLLAISNRIENSDQRAFANVNFSTIVMVMTLFGRRQPPPEEFLPPNLGPAQSFPTTSSTDVAIQSFLMSSVTGLCEETVFRQLVPSMIAATTGHPSWAFVGQAVLFGLGHSNPKSPTSENAIVVGLQVINGLGFGLIYLLSGGDIVPCVVAHAFYDFVTFFATWASANGQLEYAERMYQEPLSPDQERQVQELLQGASRQRLDPKLYRAIKRLFYTFDFDKNKTLSLSEVRKGVAYMALERAGTPPPQQQVDQLFLAAVEARKRSAPSGIDSSGGRDDNRLSFADFLRLYLSMLSRAANQPAAAA